MTSRFRVLLALLEETKHLRGCDQKEVAKIVLCGELGILNARPVNSSVRRTQKAGLV